MKKYLDLNFNDERGKIFKLRVHDPKDGLDSIEVKALADDVVAYEAFTNRGYKLAELDNAKITTISTQDLDLS